MTKLEREAYKLQWFNIQPLQFINNNTSFNKNIYIICQNQQKYQILSQYFL